MVATAEEKGNQEGQKTQEVSGLKAGRELESYGKKETRPKGGSADETKTEVLRLRRKMEQKKVAEEN